MPEGLWSGVYEMMNRRRLLQRGKAQVLAQDQTKKIRDPKPEHPQEHPPEHPPELLAQARAVEASVASASAHSDASALVPLT